MQELSFPRSLRRRKSSLASCFASDRTGLAAIEFALLAPIMVFMFFATVEGSDALATSRRVTQSVNTIADLVAQETEIQTAALGDLFVGMEDIIDTGAITVDFRVVSLIVDPDTNDVVVHWSRDNSGGTPYAAGTVYSGPADVSLLDPTASIIVGEVQYDYTPSLTNKLLPSVAFNKHATRWPRRTFRVQLCTTPTSCTS